MNEEREMSICIDSLKVLQIDLRDVNLDRIKKGYRRLCRQYHPDQYSHANTTIQHSMQQKYIQIQNAYQILMKYGIETIKRYVNAYHLYCEKANQENNIIPIKKPVKREAKIFASNKEAARLNKLQKAYKEDKKKQTVMPKQRSFGKRANKNSVDQAYEDALNKISAIWIAEVIHRQIQEDKKKKEKENKEKLYKAFMQYNENQQNENI